MIETPAIRRFGIATLVLLFVTAMSARGTTVRDVCRIKGQGSSVLQGLGLVVGLNGSGDSGEELVMARPLAAVLANNGLPIGDFEELASSQSVALVLVQCRTPKEGSQVDDRLDITVSVINSATSLEGGELYLTPLTGPYPGSPVFAMAAGPIELDGANPARGRVRGGAQITQGIHAAPIADSFELVLETPFAGYQSAVHVAERIRDEHLLRPSGFDEAAAELIAEPIDDRTIRVRIPPESRLHRAEFIADVMNTLIDPSQMKLPAQVIVNRESGAIVVTGDVRISLVAISHKNLVIRRITPEPEPTPANPVIETDRVVGLGTTPRDRERAALEDLLDAFKQLSVPVEDQIQILQMMHKTGRLHAELIID